MKVIVAAAGTGGHINPGIAIANKIKEEEPNSEIIFIGTKRGLEMDLVPRAGYELKTVDSHGINRSFTIKNIANLLKTIKSIGEAKKIIKEFEPDLVIGTGGYICITVCMAAKSLKIPYIIHESNAMPGVATKFMGRKAGKILVGFEDAKSRLPNVNNIIVTGTPTKNRNLNYDQQTIKNKKEQQGFEGNKPLVLVFGGSQGAQSINSSMSEIIAKGLNNENYQIIWAAGPKQYEIIKKELSEQNLNINNIEGIKIVPYIYNMEEIMNIADLIVSRSGAMTITEIEKMGKPAIFIPFPFATENHQEFNARAIEKDGAAKVILDKELDANILDKTIKNLIKDKEALQKMGEASKRLAINNVEDRIYVEIKELGGKNGR